MTIAAKHFDPQLGIDIHTYLIPPSPIPIPLPTPHIGIVLDPFDYLPFIGGTVHVNGLKRATAGTGGLDIHIPVGGAWMPPLKIAAGPQWDDELFMGSKTVLADGDPFSKITMPVLACNIVGMIAPFRIRKPKKPHMSLLLPTTFNIAIPTNVFVGGPPTVSWTALAMGAGLSIFGKILKKTGIAGAAGAAFKKLRQKVFGNMKPGFLKCKVLRAEPVDIRDGSVSVTHEDFAIPGRLPLTWTREYRSTDTHAGQCGHGWHTPADVRLALDADGSALFHGPDMPALFPHLPQGEGIEHAVREFVDGARLIREGHELWVRTKDGLRYGFAAGPANLTALHARVLPIERIEDLCGNYWRFERGNGQLVRIVESGIEGLQGRFLEIDSRHGRIDRMQLHDPATGLNYPLVSYRYQDGDLAAALDALDAARTFEYRQHRMVRHTDRVGLSFHYAYDAQWRVVRAWGDGGLHDYKFRYDDLLEETEITDSLGYVSIVKFDENGLPLCEIDPLDGVTVFEYDEVGRTTAVVDPMGLRTQFAYDERGNLLKLTRADGSVLITEYDPDDHAETFFDAMKSRWLQKWNDRGLLCEQITPLGAVSSYGYDELGQLTSHTDARGSVTRLVFDRHGRACGVTDPKGGVSRFEYDALGSMLKSIDPLGRQTHYRYDPKGRLLSAGLPGGSESRYEYDSNDRVVRRVDESGATTKIEYCGQGRIARHHDANKKTVSYRYDTEERLIAVINQRGEVYGFQRDPLGRVEAEIDYWGQARTYRYDAADRPVDATDSLGRCIEYKTDHLGRIIARSMPHTDRPGQVLTETFKYDPRGRLIELKNADRRVIRTYDSEDRVLREQQDEFCVDYRYDSVGNRIAREARCGNRIGFSYDACGQLIGVAVNDEVPSEIERDALGRILEDRLSPGMRRRFSYTDDGLLASQKVMNDDALLFGVEYAYGSDGNLTEQRDSQYGRDQFAYDPVGRLLSHTNPQGRISNFLNDPAGDRLHTRVDDTRMKRVVGDASLACEWAREGSYAGVDYTFDRAGNMTRRNRLNEAPSPGRDGDLLLRWDAGNRLIQTSKAGHVTRYGYDALGRRAFKRTAEGTFWFFWDGDVLLAEVYEENVPAQIDRTHLPAGGPVDFIAARKRRVACESLYGKAREYLFHPQTFVPLLCIDRSAQAMQRTEGSAADRSQAMVFTAKAEVQTERSSPPRTLASIDPASSSKIASTRLIVVHKSEPSTAGALGALGGMRLGAAPKKMQERDPALPTPANALSGDGDALGLGIAQPVGRRLVDDVADKSTSVSRSNSPEVFDAVASPLSPSRTAQQTPQVPVCSDVAVPPSIYYYHVDPRGCAVRLTDASGRVVWAVEYEAWGAIAHQHVDQVRNPIRFQGQYHDSETGLHYNRHRYYDPWIGQFIAQDPIGLEGGLNVYEYGPNPLRWIDPLGLASQEQPPHRGRLQAQGVKLEESFSWSQHTPITASDALAGLDELEASLDKKERLLRKQEFAKARAFIKKAAQAGGVDAPVSKTFLVKGTKHERVDIEVNKGRAFVPDPPDADGIKPGNTC